MNCGTCKHWDLKGSPMREHGFGRCKVEPDHAKRISRTFSTQNLCRLDKFAKAPVAVIARRERELA